MSSNEKLADKIENILEAYRDGCIGNSSWDERVKARKEIVYLFENQLPSAMNIGDYVQKTSGYKFNGIIVAKFPKLSGEIRYVVECIVPDCEGMLHIFNEGNLKLVNSKQEDKCS